MNLANKYIRRRLEKQVGGRKICFSAVDGAAAASAERLYRQVAAAANRCAGAFFAAIAAATAAVVLGRINAFVGAGRPIIVLVKAAAVAPW